LDEIAPVGGLNLLVGLTVHTPRSSPALVGEDTRTFQHFEPARRADASAAARVFRADAVLDIVAADLERVLAL
jgi:hypothetical protein